MSNDVVSRKDVPFGVTTTKNYISTPLLPKKNENFGTLSTGRLKKTLTMGMLTCKLHLIIIVASWKLYSEYANRCRGMEIWGQRRLPIYRSRDPAKFWTKNLLKRP